jgi:hypothetical protein
MFPSYLLSNYLIVNIFIWLVVWNIFPYIGMSSSQLTFIFFRGVAQPPTSSYYGSYTPLRKTFGSRTREAREGREPRGLVMRGAMAGNDGYESDTLK